MSTVFKYYSPTEYNLDALENGYFFLCMAKHQNDPFELSFSLYKSLNIDPRQYPEGYEPLKDYGICCFTSDASNKRMWAHYADNYKGFVVEYDEKFLEHVNFEWKGQPKHSLPRLYFNPVEYVENVEQHRDPDTLHTIFYLNHAPQTFHIHQGMDEKEMEYLFIHLCRIKEKRSWQEENEVRLIGCRDLRDPDFIPTCQRNGVEFLDSGYKVPFRRDIVKNIYIGHNMEDRERRRIMAYAQHYGLAVIHEVKPSDRPFELTAKMIEI